MGRERLNRTSFYLSRSSGGWVLIFMGLIFALVGGFFTLAGFRFNHWLDGGDVNAPYWVIGAVGLTFLLPGLLLFVQGLRGSLNQARRRRQQQPHRLWLGDYPWHPGGIRNHPYRRGLGNLLGALFMLGFLAPFNWWAWLSDEGNLFLQIIVGLFDLFGLIALVTAIYSLLQALKWGGAQLSFGHFPFAPGERLRLGFSPNRFEQLEATLRYVEERYEVHGSGKNRRSSAYTYQLYHTSQTLRPNLDRDETTIEFELPDNPEWTTRLTDTPSIFYWELELNAQVPGIDFATQFPLPVYPNPTGYREQRSLRPRRVGLRSVPYLFEFGLPLLLAALLYGGWQLAPQAWHEQLQGIVQHYQARQALEKLDLMPSTAAAALAEDASGRLWALDKYGVVRIEAGQASLLLSTQSYRNQFGQPMDALSALHVNRDGTTWVGSWYGELLRFRDGQWQRLSRRDNPLGKRIIALAHDGERLWIAGREGLWVRPDSSAILQRIEAVGSGKAGALLLEAGRLCAAIDDGLWCQQGGEWHQQHSAEGTIQALASDGQGGLWVGHRAGLDRLNSVGEMVDCQLDGVDIRAIQRSRGELWVGSWKQGVFHQTATGWRHLPGSDVADLAIYHEQLWIAVSGEGLLHLPLSAADRLMQ